jgi:hypothetical protein
MDTMRIRPVVLAACFLLFAMSHFAIAAPDDNPPNTAINSLAGTAVPTTQLGELRARGSIIVSSTNNGTVSNNTINGNTTTGTIMNSESANNNAGLTTIFQNTGNNALLQNSTSIYISIH